MRSGSAYHLSFAIPVRSPAPPRSDSLQHQLLEFLLARVFVHP
jgi:hypothetical protein